MFRPMRLSPHLTTRRPGQTLIEMITVLFIIAITLVAVLTLTTTNARNAAIGILRLSASQLAREGIEVARNTRDSNWMAGRAWNTKLEGDATNHCARIKDTVDGTLFDGLEPKSCAGSTPFSPAFALYRGANGTFYHQDSPTASDIGTGFYRRTTLDPICAVAGASTETVAVGSATCSIPVDLGSQIGLQVRVEVGTQAGGRDTIVTMVERLYNWR